MFGPVLVAEAVAETVNVPVLMKVADGTPVVAVPRLASWKTPSACAETFGSRIGKPPIVKLSATNDADPVASAETMKVPELVTRAAGDPPPSTTWPTPNAVAEAFAKLDAAAAALATTTNVPLAALKKFARAAPAMGGVSLAKTSC
jgi:hypothetical protein